MRKYGDSEMVKTINLQLTEPEKEARETARFVPTKISHPVVLREWEEVIRFIKDTYPDGDKADEIVQQACDLYLSNRRQLLIEKLAHIFLLSEIKEG